MHRHLSWKLRAALAGACLLGMVVMDAPTALADTNMPLIQFNSVCSATASSATYQADVCTGNGYVNSANYAWFENAFHKCYRYGTEYSETVWSYRDLQWNEDDIPVWSNWVISSYSVSI